ncbi:glutathione S-transferase family protein [Kushneria aurantia]|uniref:Glutathione S-transferase family protein n=1 Tax=Kushneria aurantia TaxID=504092 RepID=A0ABV6G7C4_9GAMM|nr:glutathione S-transferase family protein [Kushneria aurantia]
MITVYGDYRSGNCYKVQLTLSILGIAHRWFDIDFLAGETHSDAWAARNPARRIPLLELHDGRTLVESNAIVHYLARGSALLPADDFDHARMLQWMFFEQHRHEPSLSVARLIHWYHGDPADRHDELIARQEGARQALDIMEQTLAEDAWLAGERMSLADIALFAHTHIADQAGVPLWGWPRVTEWCARIEQCPGFVPMQQVSGIGDTIDPYP